jgi:hypothetical protein
MDRLRELVSLVHCRYHAGEKFTDPRIQEWKSLFPAGSGPLPVGEQIGKLVRKLSKTCSGQGKEGPCRMKLGGQKIQNAHNTTAELMRPEVYLDEYYRDYALKVMIDSTFCYLHIDQGDDVRRTWRSQISRLCKDIDRRTSTRASSPTTPSRIIRSHREGTPPATCWPITADVSPFRTRIEADRPTTKQACYPLIRAEILKPIDAKNSGAGYIYAYTVPGNEGFVKIGYTTKSVGERMSDWAFGCNRTSQVAYPDLRDLPLDKVRLANRVEQLCLTELRYRNERVVCGGCIQEHTEWVRVPVKEVVAVIEKWKAWMRTEPYVKREMRSGGATWLLASDVNEGVNDMSRFMEGLSKKFGSKGRS